MKYTKEELSPTKVKVAVTVEAEEINAAISAGVAMQQKGISLHGFRKGHVPAGVIEKRFKTQIYRDAANDLTNVHLNKILDELKLTPVTGLNVTPTPIVIERDTPVEYTVEFEHMPVFDLPVYDGLEVEQSRFVTISPEEVNRFLENLRAKNSRLVPVDGDGPAQDGDLVNMDFAVIVDGEEATSSKGIDYAVGQEGAFADLDAFVRTLRVNEDAEKEVTFPEDFVLASVRGKTGTMKAHVYAIKRQSKPTDEELVTMFKMQSIDELRAEATSILVQQKNTLARSEAQTRLLEKLLGMVDFPLPEALIEGELDAFVQRESQRAMQVGKTLSDEQIKEIREKNLEKAQKQVKSYVLLRKVADNENLQTTERELQLEVARLAQSMSGAGQPVDPKALYKYYAENGILYTVRDQLLINKAVDAIYAKANVHMTEEGEAPAADACSACGKDNAACAGCASAPAEAAAEKTEEAADKAE